MELDEEVTLITVKNVKNQNGFAEQQEAKLTVDCREKSATRTEFYEALRSNITISLVLEVRIEDFELTGYVTPNRKKAYATKAEYDGAVYDIVRAYKSDKSMVELICS